MWLFFQQKLFNHLDKKKKEKSKMETMFPVFNNYWNNPAGVSIPFSHTTDKVNLTATAIAVIGKFLAENGNCENNTVEFRSNKTTIWQ